MAGLSLTSFINERAITGNPLLCNRLFRDRVCKAKSLYSRNLVGHYGCVNAIEFSNKGGQFLASGGDDRRVLLWNIQEALSLESKFEVMKGEHHSNIFSLAFDSQNTKLYSGGNDDQVLVHDLETKETLDVFLHEDAVYGLAVDPRDSHIFTSACADGRILQWDTRVPSHQEPFVIANYQTAFYAVVHHPMEPQFLATANSKEGVALWDVRAPRSCLMQYGSAYTQQNAMSVRFNQLGTRLVALRRRLPPVVYNIQSSAAAIQFNHSGYYNSCTMKSCTFAGDRDQYVLSGSDDFSLYMWEVPEASEDVTWVGEAKLVLQGHRSIVNQVRFNTCTHNIVSSGVEKVIKLWSPFDFPNTENDENPRQMFSHQQYIDLVINSGTALSHDYADQSMEEDPRMIAFFDSLVQREINRSFSDSDDSEMSPESLYLHFAGEGEDSEDARDSNSGSSIASFRAVVRMAEENDDTSPTSQLRTLWNLTSATRTSANAVVRTTESSSDDSEVKTSKLELIEKLSATHSNSGVRENCSTFADEIAGTSRVSQPVENGAAHRKTQMGSEGTSSKRKHRQVPSSSTSQGSSSSDEDMNFQELRAKSRMLRRFVKKKKRKAGTDSDDSLPSSGQKEVNTDRFINLQQRIAISKVLQGKIRRPGERVVRSGRNEGETSRINEHLQQRAMASQQRLAISRMRQRLQQENILSLGDTRTEVRESNNISQDHQDVNIRTLPVGSVAPSCSTMPNQRTTDDDHASVYPPSQSSVHNSNCLPANVNLDSNPSSSSLRVTERQDESSRILSLLNSNDESTQSPSCSGEMSQVQVSTGNHEEDLPREDADGQHSNKFHKFKNQSKRSQRKYRSHSVKKNKDNSGTE